MINKIGVLILVFLGVGCLGSCLNTSSGNTKDDSNESSLKSAFQQHFLIGAAINENQILGIDSVAVRILKTEYNTISPENCMKWMYLHPEVDVFDFQLADQYVAFGEENNMFIVGHTLLWHSQIAGFMAEVKDSATMANYIENHISTIASRYSGRIDSWDVLNEALNEDGSLRNSIFLKVIGENYIEQAFRSANTAAPNTELVYNDYNLCAPVKREGVVRMVKELKDKGVKIDGVGMQGHWGLTTPSIEEIEKSIIAYSDLGVKVSISELDITVLPNPWDLEGAEVGQDFKKFEGDEMMNPYPNNLPDSIQIKLAQRYEDIFRLFLKYEDKISRVTFWGVTDKHSWLNDWPIKGRSNYPLLFDRNSKPKKAYYSLIDLTKNPR